MSAPPSTSPRIRLAASCVTGPERNWNEDAYAVFDLAGGAPLGPQPATAVLPRDPGAVLLVLDGMGGARTGGLACTVALRTLVTFFRGAVPASAGARRAWLEEALRAASDVILLSSDGLHGALPDTTITSALHAHPEPEEACRALVGLAESAPSSDNITVIVASV